jgi:predicted RNA-binding Zn ribbon-like protein
MTKQDYSPFRLVEGVKEVNMVFAHDTELALAAAAALVNTEQPDGDDLADVAALDRFVAHWGWTGSRRGDQGELDGVRALRPRLRELWHLDEDAVVVSVNSMLRETHALPQLVAHDGWSYHLHATPPDAPLADRMLVEAAMAVVDVVRSAELDRLRVCDAPDCDDVVVDLSKNHSRRYCSTSCSNRVNMAAFRARRSGG